MAAGKVTSFTDIDKQAAQLEEIANLANSNSNPHLVKLRLLGPEACVSTLQQKWATHAVVGALIASCTYGNIVSPPQQCFDDSGDLTVTGGLFLLSITLSFVFAVSNIMAALFASTELSVFILNRRDLGWFLVKWTGTGKGGFNFIDFPDQLMIVSLIFILLSSIPGLLIHGRTWPLITFACAGIAIVLVVLSICIFFLTRVIKYYSSQYGSTTTVQAAPADQQAAENHT